MYWNKQLYSFLDCLKCKNVKAKIVTKPDDYFCSIKEKKVVAKIQFIFNSLCFTSSFSKQLIKRGPATYKDNYFQQDLEFRP